MGARKKFIYQRISLKVFLSNSFYLGMLQISVPVVPELGFADCKVFLWQIETNVQMLESFVSG